MGFRKHFRGASPSFTAMVFSHPRNQQQQQQKRLQQQEKKVAKIHFLWVSEVMLGIFGVQFWGFSVLHCHGVVFPSGDQQQQQQKRLQQQEEKPAKIHSSSKRKAAKIIIFYGFQKLRYAFPGCNFGASPSFTAMVFSHPGTRSSSSKILCRKR